MAYNATARWFAEPAELRQGATCAVYSDGEVVDRIVAQDPLDGVALVPILVLHAVERRVAEGRLAWKPLLAHRSPAG